MTAKIYLSFEADTASEVREQMARMLGVTPRPLEVLEEPVVGDDSPLRRHAVAETPEPTDPADVLPPNDKPGQIGEAEAPKRKRRTKAEIEAEKAALAADPQAAGKPAEEAAPLISTGEERIDPTTEADDAQDAADEAAEVEATAKPELTHDDVRAALTEYMNAYGQPAVMVDGPKVLEMLFGAVAKPAKPESGWKVSDVPNDQASLQKAVDGVNEMLVKNPFQRGANL